MEHKHYLTITQWYFDFDYYESTFYFDFSSQHEFIIKRIDQSLIDNSLPEQSEIRFPVEKTNSTREKILDLFLIDLLLHKGNFYGVPYFDKSDIIDEEIFNHCKKRAGDIIDERNNKIREGGENHPLILLCHEHHLYPEPEGSSPYNWQANCPSRRAHHFYLSTHSSTWGCGYCKRKGGLDELKEWMKER